MSRLEERSLGFLFGALGAVLLLLEGILDFVGGFLFLAFGYGGHALVVWDRSVLDVIVGLIVGLFAVYGRSGSKDRAFAAGVVLVLVAIVSWFALGFADGLLAIVGTLLALLSGVLYLISSR